MADVKAESTEQKVVKESETVQTEKTETAIPYARFKEVNEKAKELQDKLDKIDADKKTAAEQKLLDEKKYKELLEAKDGDLKREREEKKVFEEKAKAYEEQEKAQREELLAKIKDEGDKKIAGDLSTANLRLFVDKLETKAGPSGTKGAHGSSGADNPYVKRDGESYPQYQTRINKLRSGGK